MNNSIASTDEILDGEEQCIKMFGENEVGSEKPSEKIVSLMKANSKISAVLIAEKSGISSRAIGKQMVHHLPKSEGLD